MSGGRVSGALALAGLALLLASCSTTAKGIWCHGTTTPQGVETLRLFAADDPRWISVQPISRVGPDGVRYRFDGPATAEGAENIYLEITADDGRFELYCFLKSRADIDIEELVAREKDRLRVAYATLEEGVPELASFDGIRMVVDAPRTASERGWWRFAALVALLVVSTPLLIVAFFIGRAYYRTRGSSLGR